MLSYDYTKDLLNLQDAIIDKIENLSDTVKIYIHLPVKSHHCKECHSKENSFSPQYYCIAERLIFDIFQKKYGKENRLLFKHSKRLLTMRKAKLSPEQLEQVEYLLYLSDDLRSAYFYYNINWLIYLTTSWVVSHLIA